MGYVCIHPFISFISFISFVLTNIIVSLCKQYKGFAQCLIQTGGGLQNDETEEQIQYKVPGDGPNAETSSDAKNLWGEFSHMLPIYLRSFNSIFERPNCA